MSAPGSLPADFFDKAPDTLPADFFKKEKRSPLTLQQAFGQRPAKPTAQPYKAPVVKGVQGAIDESIRRKKEGERIAGEMGAARVAAGTREAAQVFHQGEENVPTAIERSINPPGTPLTKRVPSALTGAGSIVRANLEKIRKETALAAVAAPFKALSPQIELGSPENRRSALQKLGGAVSLATGDLARIPYMNDEDKGATGLAYVLWTIGGEAAIAGGKKAIEGIGALAKGLQSEREVAASVKAGLDAAYNKNLYLQTAKDAYEKGGMKGLRQFAKDTGAEVVNKTKNQGRPKGPAQPVDLPPGAIPEPTAPVTQPPKTVAPPVPEIESPALQEPPVPEPASTSKPPVKEPLATEPLPSTPGGTAVANVVTKVIRSALKLPGFDKVAKKDLSTFAQGAVDKGYTNLDSALAIATDIVKNGKGALDHEQGVGLASVLDGLVAKHGELSAQLENMVKFGGDEGIANELSRLRDQIGTITDAANIAGTEWGRSGVARQVLMKADTSAAGIIARRQKIAGRKLTSAELMQATKESEALKNAGIAKDARIAELEAQLGKAEGERFFSEARKTFKPPAKERIVAIDAKIKDAGERLAKKWADNAPGPGLRSTSPLFGADILAEQAVRVAKVAPEILEISRYHFEKGVLTLEENVKATIATFRKHGVKDLTDKDVAAVIAGQIKSERAHPVTAWEDFKAEARSQFSEARNQRQQQAKFIEQKARDIQKEFQGAERAKAEQALKTEREAYAREHKAAKQAEDAFWKDVRSREREYQKGERSKLSMDRQNYLEFWRKEISHQDNMAKTGPRAEKRAAAESKAAGAKDLREREAAYQKDERAKASNARKEYMNFWRGSVAGQREAVVTRISNLQNKLDIFEKDGVIMGAKSKIKQAEDPLLNQLKIKEASLRNQMHEIDRKMKLQTEYDNLGPLRQSLSKYNAWTFSRSVVASFDNSFPLNQGGTALFSDPKSWGKGLKSSFRSMSQAGLDTVKAEIRSHPQYDRAKASGLFEEGANLADIFGASGVSKVPGIGHSERMYEGAADALRFDMFNSWVGLAEMSGKPLNLQELKALATEVKAWTGQGNWLKGQQAISKPFFALRYRMAQAEVLFGAPLARTLQLARQTGNYAPFRVVARKYAQSAATMVATSEAANWALQKTGAQIDLNPTSTNFGRLVGHKGDTTVSLDILPPPLRLAKIMSMIAMGEKTTATGTHQDASDFKNKDLQEKAVADYLTSGLHPVPALAWAIAKGRKSDDQTYYGRSVDFTKAQAWKDTALQFLPISIQNIKEVWDDPNLEMWEKIIASSVMPMANVNARRPFQKPPAKGKETAGRIYE